MMRMTQIDMEWLGVGGVIIIEEKRGNMEQNKNTWKH